ncbi:hypothetical protein [Actinomadura hibisca]|uniref:hypothetical protein n=1 Tax=Actinomadura hibisca TaxID=68565 RepID=UPI0012F8846C|nr:hypothetical protein [Actinomadura hibisca]
MTIFRSSLPGVATQSPALARSGLPWDAHAPSATSPPTSTTITASTTIQRPVDERFRGGCPGCWT